VSGGNSCGLCVQIVMTKFTKVTKRVKRWSVAASAGCAVALTLAGGAGAHVRQTASSTTSSAQSTHTHHKKSSKRHHSTRMHLPAAPSPDRISEIQSALARGGYYKGDPNGKWDADTIAATEKFQADNGLDSTGKLDAPTLQKLGLGSDIAGVSAPKPVVPRPTPSTPATTPASPSDKSTSPTQAQPLATSGSVTTASNSSSAVSDPKSPQH
jgi:Putative peptidoglycan binding domain